MPVWGNFGLFCRFSPNLPRIHVGLYCKGKWKTKVKTLSILSDVYCLFSSMYSEEVTLLSIDSVLIYFSMTSVISLVIHEFIRSRDQRVKKKNTEWVWHASMALFLVKLRWKHSTQLFNHNSTTSVLYPQNNLQSEHFVNQILYIFEN